MTSEVIYLGDLRTRATHLASGQALVTDAPVDNQGKGEAFSPTDLCATSLASCILTIMGIRARDEGIDMTGTRIRVNKRMVADPDRRIGGIDLEILMPDRGYSDGQKEVLEDAAASCPVCRSLHPLVDIRKSILWT